MFCPLKHYSVERRSFSRPIVYHSPPCLYHAPANIDPGISSHPLTGLGHYRPRRLLSGQLSPTVQDPGQREWHSQKDCRRLHYHVRDQGSFSSDEVCSQSCLRRGTGRAQVDFSDDWSMPPSTPPTMSSKHVKDWGWPDRHKHATSKPCGSRSVNDAARYKEPSGTINSGSSKLNTMDGAFDGVDERPSLDASRTPSLLDLPSQADRLSRVRLLSDDRVKSRNNPSHHDDTDNRFAQSESGNKFRNPFSDDEGPSSRNLSISSSASSYLRPNAFPGHRDTLARLPLYGHSRVWSNRDDEEPNQEPCLETSGITSARTDPLHRDSCSSNSTPAKPCMEIFLPRQVVTGIMNHLSFTDYKTLRLVSRQWNASLPPPNLPAVFRLPRETLQEIYSHLSPVDFDAARHTCKAWLLASLDRSVLRHYLRSSHAQHALVADLRGKREYSARGCQITDVPSSSLPGDHASAIDDEWICSKRLATESRLSADWRGLSRMSIIEVVDFSRILPKRVSRSRQFFTVSACGKFVLVTSLEDIFLYTLCAPERTIAPVIQLAAGTEVLDVSMDTSSDRFSVATLLAGRVGMVWDLDGIGAPTEYCNSSGETINLGMQADILSSAISQARRPLALNLPTRSHRLVMSDTLPLGLSPPTSVLSGATSPGFVPSPPSL